jgi:hypothetical protein
LQYECSLPQSTLSSCGVKLLTLMLSFRSNVCRKPDYKLVLDAFDGDELVALA